MNKCKFCEAKADSIDPELCCACEAARVFIEHCPRMESHQRARREKYSELMDFSKLLDEGISSAQE